MSSPSPYTTLALQRFHGGELAAAEQLCRKALSEDSCDKEALHLLGVVQGRQGQLTAAAETLRQAAVLAPLNAETHYNLGVVCQTLERLDEAVASYRQALRLRPGHAEAHNNLGFALTRLGRFDEAEAELREALRLKPDHAPAHNNLGLVLGKKNLPAQAISAFRRAIELNADYVEAWLNLGIALQTSDQLAEAVACYERVLRKEPRSAKALNNLGYALAQQGKLTEATANLEEAVRISPENASAYNNMGLALARLGKIPEAIDSLRRALALRPRYAAAHNNLGMALCQQSQFDEAKQQFDAAIEVDPGYVDAHLNRAQLALVRGDLLGGWTDYEWRWKMPGLSAARSSKPAWDGSPVRGRTILLRAEQGLGDTIQFIRFAAVLERLGARVVVQCQKSLLPLLARTPGVAAWAAHDAPEPDCDFQAPLLSVPRLLRLALDDIPAATPYVFADPVLQERWRGDLGQRAGFKIGIAWQGNPKYVQDRLRSIPLRHFAALAKVPGVRLISLQKGHGTEQLREADGLFVVEDISDRLTESAGAFTDTAAAMTSVDLVITSDTATAHLAGALDVPVWVALSVYPHWAWLLGRPDSPWYPTMRLFRQPRLGDWETVFAQMAEALGPLTSVAPRRQGLGAVLVEISPGELIDKITILEIKRARITAAAKQANVRAELAELIAARDRTVPRSGELDALTAELRQVNEALWDVEDELRDCERAAAFGEPFVALARSVYLHNDRRSAVKRRINDLLGARIVEEKSYGSDAR